MKFARRTERMADKSMLSVMQLSDEKDIISFAGGFPSPETYPVEDIKKSFYAVLEEQADEALSYSSTSGYAPLRAQIARRMRRNYGLEYSAEEIIVTSGSQQALDMSGLLFIDPGDVILFETPSYLGGLNALKAYEAETVAVSTDRDGIVIADLKEKLEQYGDRVKLIYVIPDYQNPTGRSWAPERRRAFMDLVSRYDVAVLEDAAYSEIAFDGEVLPPLASFDRKGQVIYCGTFSKTFCPGLRIGWIAARQNMIEPYLMVKNNVDLSSCAITQLQLVHYLTHNDLDAHIEEIRTLYRARRDLMLSCIKREFPADVKVERPQGGLFIWATMPEGKSARVLLERAVAQKVAFVPGGSFYAENPKENTMRLNFSNMQEEEIREGIARLGRLLKDYLAE